MGMRLRVWLVVLLGIACGQAWAAPPLPDWSVEIAPFKIAGNLYYVGSADLASYLVVTPQGDILINSNMATSPPLIRRSVEKLGFKMRDIKILLISHAHYDHAAGSAEILRMTGAKYMVMDGDVAGIESGGRRGVPEPNFPTYPPAKVSRVLHDGDTVTLGGSTLVAHKTPGHTPGCTTWTMVVQEGGRSYNVVVLGSPNLNAGTNLVSNKLYPRIAEDFETGFRVALSLPCDIFLGAHGVYFDMKQKIARMQAGEKNVFVDPEGYRLYILNAQAAFEKELAKQQGP